MEMQRGRYWNSFKSALIAFKTARTLTAQQIADDTGINVSTVRAHLDIHRCPIPGDEYIGRCQALKTPTELIGRSPPLSAPAPVGGEGSLTGVIVAPPTHTRAAWVNCGTSLSSCLTSLPVTAGRLRASGPLSGVS